MKYISLLFILFSLTAYSQTVTVVKDDGISDYATFIPTESGTVTYTISDYSSSNIATFINKVDWGGGRIDRPLSGSFSVEAYNTYLFAFNQNFFTGNDDTTATITFSGVAGSAIQGVEEGPTGGRPVKWLDKNGNNNVNSDEIYDESVDLTASGELVDYSTIIYLHDNNGDGDCDQGELSYSREKIDDEVVNKVDMSGGNIPVQMSFDANAGIDEEENGNRKQCKYYNANTYDGGPVSQGELFTMSSQIQGATIYYWEDKNNDGDVDSGELFSDSGYSSEVSLYHENITLVGFNEAPDADEDGEDDEDEDEEDSADDLGDITDEALAELEDEFTADKLYEEVIAEKDGFAQKLQDKLNQMPGIGPGQVGNQVPDGWFLPFSHLHEDLDDVELDLQQDAFNFYHTVGFREMMLVFMILFTSFAIFKTILGIAA